MTDGKLTFGLDCVPDSARGCVLSVGNFDGVHLGHQRICSTARSLADPAGLGVVAITFDPLPDAVFHPDHAHQRITPVDQEARLLGQAGADHVVCLRTDRALLGMPARQFVDEVIVAKFAPRHVVEGRDFAFGASRAGTVDLLRQAGGQAGFEVHVVDEVMMDLPEGPDRISSTLIRMLLRAGRIEDANRCLGREFALYDRIVPGQGHGRVLEFPTANIHPSEQILPADGVYAGRATIDGRRFAAAVSIGRKPTFGPAEQTYVEAFLIDGEGDFYGQAMELSFVGRLRDQMKFETTEALRAQIACDVARVREICG